MAAPAIFAVWVIEMQPAPYRIGFLVPPGNIAVERELAPVLPTEVSLHCNRLSRPDSTLSADSLLAMLSSLPRAAKDLAQTYPDVIVYACTSGSFLKPDGKPNSIAGDIERLTGIAAITTSDAVIEALHFLHLQKIFMLTPYTWQFNELETSFLNGHGITVVGADSFYCNTSEEIRKITTDQVKDRVLQHRDAISQCDGVFISCTQMLSLACLDALEQALARPVVSSNQASLWAALCRIACTSRPNSGGRLLTHAR